MSAVIDHLTQVPLFRGMTQSALEAIAGLASETEFTDGQDVTREGDEGDAFYVVVDGTLVISQNGMTVRNLGPGDFLGEISLIDGRPRTATATAEGPVKALVVRRPEFLELMDRYGAVRLGVLMALTERVRSDEAFGFD
jgi:CRP-like cAMP-binding protein